MAAAWTTNHRCQVHILRDNTSKFLKTKFLVRAFTKVVVCRRLVSCDGQPRSIFLAGISCGYLLTVLFVDVKKKKKKTSKKTFRILFFVYCSDCMLDWIGELPAINCYRYDVGTGIWKLMDFYRVMLTADSLSGYFFSIKLYFRLSLSVSLLPSLSLSLTRKKKCYLTRLTSLSSLSVSVTFLWRRLKWRRRKSTASFW